MTVENKTKQKKNDTMNITKKEAKETKGEFETFSRKQTDNVLVI